MRLSKKLRARALLLLLTLMALCPDYGYCQFSPYASVFYRQIRAHTGTVGALADITPSGQWLGIINVGMYSSISVDSFYLYNNDIGFTSDLVTLDAEEPRSLARFSGRRNDVTVTALSVLNDSIALIGGNVRHDTLFINGKPYANGPFSLVNQFVVKYNFLQKEAEWVRFLTATQFDEAPIALKAGGQYVYVLGSISATAYTESGDPLNATAAKPNLYLTRYRLGGGYDPGFFGITIQADAQLKDGRVMASGQNALMLSGDTAYVAAWYTGKPTISDIAASPARSIMPAHFGLLLAITDKTVAFKDIQSDYYVKPSAISMGRDGHPVIFGQYGGDAKAVGNTSLSGQAQNIFTVRWNPYDNNLQMANLIGYTRGDGNINGFWPEFALTKDNQSGRSYLSFASGNRDSLWVAQVDDDLKLTALSNTPNLGRPKMLPLALRFDKWHNLRMISPAHTVGSFCGVEMNAFRGRNIMFVHFMEPMRVNSAPAGAAILKVWPTPADKQLNVEIAGMAARSVQLYSAAGKELLSRRLTPGRHALEVGTFAPGLYFLRVGHQEVKVHISR